MTNQVKKNLKKYGRKNKLMKVGIVIAVICLLAIYPCFRFMEQKKSFRMTADGYQNVIGEEVPMTEGTRLVMDDERGITENGDEAIPGLPIYGTKGEWMLLPVNYEIIFPAEAETMKKLPYFTSIERKDYTYFASIDGKEKILQNCFLFDGADTYVFLAETKLTVGDREIVLSPFSYVTAPYRQAGGIYNYEDKGYIDIAEDAGEVKAELEQGAVLYLDTDRLSSGETQLLLHTEPENLKNYE